MPKYVQNTFERKAIKWQKIAVIQIRSRNLMSRNICFIYIKLPIISNFFTYKMAISCNSIYYQEFFQINKKNVTNPSRINWTKDINSQMRKTKWPIYENMLNSLEICEIKAMIRAPHWA